MYFDVDCKESVKQNCSENKKKIPKCIFRSLENNHFDTYKSQQLARLVARAGPRMNTLNPLSFIIQYLSQEE